MLAWMDPPDGDLGGFGESHGALEPRINLSHLHGSFQADHLEPTVAEICHETTKKKMRSHQPPVCQN